MRLTTWSRALLLGVVLAALLAAALLAAALATARWAEARAHRSANPRDSSARVALGLFGGEAALNPGYGWRNHRLSVRGGWYPARQWAWLGTALLASAALAAAVLSAVLAALNVAARPHAAPRGLRALAVCSTLVVVLSACGVCVWGAEFQLRLQHNVMSAEELAHSWSSEGEAELGLSYWLAVGATACALLGLLCLACAARAARAAPPAPALQDKHSAAIMLY